MCRLLNSLPRRTRLPRRNREAADAGLPRRSREAAHAGLPRRSREAAEAGILPERVVRVDARLSTIEL